MDHLARLLIIAALGLLAISPAAAASEKVRAAWAKTAFKPGEVVVDGEARATRPGETVTQAIQRLKKRGVEAHPNWIARAAFIPNDPGESGVPGGWQGTQWNLLGPPGVDAPTAWDNLNNVGRPGGKGVTVAVLDTGVAYSNRGRFRRSPDLRPQRFKRGYDFVDNDPYPNDHNGHGTHVTSTIAETANNNFGLVGLAYGSRIIPVRVLDRLGEGDSVAIARGIRFATRRGADIINLSFEFSSAVTADQIPDILHAVRYAYRKGVLVVGASGNASESAVAYPARATHVLSVGAITEHGCQAEYSNTGAGLDVVAPGGGPDAELEETTCRPQEPPGRDIIQMTFERSVRRFGFPTGYVGTSMAAPHVTATAALVIASGVIGSDPTPRQIEAHLKETSTDLGRPGPDPRYGHGLINAARATTPAAPPPPPQPPPA